MQFQLPNASTSTLFCRITKICFFYYIILHYTVNPCPMTTKWHKRLFSLTKVSITLFYLHFTNIGLRKPKRASSLMLPHGWILSLCNTVIFSRFYPLITMSTQSPLRFPKRGSSANWLVSRLGYAIHRSRIHPASAVPNRLLHSTP